MAISRALNENNDIFVSNSRIAVAIDGAQVLQHTRTRLLFYLGEWFLDTSAGTPWYQEIFVKPINVNNIESILKQRIALTPELEAITGFSMSPIDPGSRILDVSFSAITIYGDISIEGLSING